jgi:hypothetical protein
VIRQLTNATVSLTQRQIRGLLARSVFCGHRRIEDDVNVRVAGANFYHMLSYAEQSEKFK